MSSKKTNKNKSTQSKKKRADNDSPWKEVLETYFAQAMMFFFPETASIIDWSRKYEFLDKEFQQISRKAKQGKRYADKLVKVWGHKGKEFWLLIHIEIQAKPEKGFEIRMFTYNFRIFDKFGKPAISLAILCDNSKDWRPKGFSFTYPGTSLDFQFGSNKLLDYQDKWAELEASDNVFAHVVMAHLKMQETQKKPKQRKAWKFSLIRKLYEKGLEEQDIRNLYRFIDWVMILPERLESEFWQELKQFEEEQTMPYLTTGERIGYNRGREEGLQEGREEGLQEGRQEGEQALILRLLSRRCGELLPQVRVRVESMNSTQLEALSEALLDFTGIDDLNCWLQEN
jgi:Domain of unknown function (DUF4351)